MKTTALISGIVIMVVGIAGLLITNSTHDLPTTEVVVLRDLTDFKQSNPQMSDILPLFDLKNSKWNGARFILTDITAVSHNHVYETSIEPESMWLGNEFDREKQVNKFFADVQKTIEVEQGNPGMTANSSIYIPIANELNHLAESTSTSKRILIYSDLMENTGDLSFYSRYNLALVKFKPEIIEKYFSNQVPIKNLKGITVYLIYQPQSSKADKTYLTAAGFYKNMLESFGATVEITTNIN